MMKIILIAVNAIIIAFALFDIENYKIIENFKKPFH